MRAGQGLAAVPPRSASQERSAAHRENARPLAAACRRQSAVNLGRAHFDFGIRLRRFGEAAISGVLPLPVGQLIGRDLAKRRIDSVVSKVRVPILIVSIDPDLIRA